MRAVPDPGQLPAPGSAQNWTCEDHTIHHRSSALHHQAPLPRHPDHHLRRHCAALLLRCCSGPWLAQSPPRKAVQGMRRQGQYGVSTLRYMASALAGATPVSGPLSSCQTTPRCTSHAARTDLHKVTGLRRVRAHENHTLGVYYAKAGPCTTGALRRLARPSTMIALAT